MSDRLQSVSSPIVTRAGHRLTEDLPQTLDILTSTSRSRYPSIRPRCASNDRIQAIHLLTSSEIRRLRLILSSSSAAHSPTPSLLLSFPNSYRYMPLTGKRAAISLCLCSTRIHAEILARGKRVCERSCAGARCCVRLATGPSPRASVVPEHAISSTRSRGMPSTWQWGSAWSRRGINARLGRDEGRRTLF